MNDNRNSDNKSSPHFSQHLPKTRFTGIFIPVEVLELENVTLLEQMLLSWIDALYCKERGGCFASNEYLATRLKVKENTIAKALTNLRHMGLIEDVSFDGRQRVILAKIGKVIDNAQSKAALDPMQGQSNADLDLNPSSLGLKSNPAMDKNPSPSIIYSKAESKEECVGQSPAPTHKKTSATPKKKSPKEPLPEKTKYGSHVEMTPEQHADRLKQYGAEKLQWMINYLDERIAINPAAAKKWSSHYHVLSPSQWVHAEYEKRQSPDTNSSPARNFNSRPSAASAHANSQIAQNAKYKYDSGCCTLAIDEKNVIFIPHHGVNPDKTFLSLYDPNFEERFEQLLKRFGFR